MADSAIGPLTDIVTDFAGDPITLNNGKSLKTSAVNGRVYQFLKRFHAARGFPSRPS